MYFLIILCLLSAIGLSGAYYAYRVAFYSPTKGRDHIKPLEGSNTIPTGRKCGAFFIS